MAREWLLRGVDPEELKPTVKEDTPQTPRSKWENFWYHYKWVFWVSLFAVVVLVVGLVQTFTRNEPDYRILLMSEKAYMPSELAALETLLESYGTDLDGDGEVEVKLENCLYSDEQVGVRNSGIDIVNTHLFAGDRMFFIWEPESYAFFHDTVVKAAEEEGTAFFTPIGVEQDGVIEDGRIWSWEGDTRPIPELQERAPVLYFGVRDVAGTAKDAKELQQQSIALLEALVADAKVAE